MKRGKGVGYAVITDPNARRAVESDTVFCVHCQRIMFLNTLDAAGKKIDLGGYCTLCHGNTCGPCAALGKCEPFEKKVDKIESRNRLLAAAAANGDPPPMVK